MMPGRGNNPDPCPKCGDGGHTIKYCSGDHWDMQNLYCIPHSGEKLIYRCNVCSFRWAKPCKEE